MTRIVACPCCQLHLEIAPDQAGREASCPGCQRLFLLPVPTANQVDAARLPYSYRVTGQPYPTDSRDPAHAEAVRNFASKKIAAGICGLLLGAFGVHKFILGLHTAGAIMLSIYLVSLIGGCLLFFPILGVFAMSIIGFVEGIIYLTKSDEEFYMMYAVYRKQWF